MADPRIGKTPPAIAVLPFYGTAALFFVALCVLLLLAADELTGHYFSPALLAAVHTAALGWGTMVIFGAAYQLLPVICERSLHSTAMAVGSYALLTVGTILLVWAFWTFRVGIPLIAGGSLVVAAALLYAINVCATVAGTSASIYRLFLVSSALWLCITTIAGLLLAINLTHTFIPRNHLDMLKLHAHAGLAGWFLQLIGGVSARLVPMFLLGKSERTGLLVIALVCQNLGLTLFLADGYFNPIDGGMLVYGGIVGIGTLAWLAYLADAYRHRLRKQTDRLMAHTFFSLACLVVGFLLLPVVHYAADTRWVSLYGTFLFLGWITGIILGKTFKTLPFIVWNIHYRHRHGTAGVPLPKHLYSERLAACQLYVYLAAFSTLAAGLWMDSAWVIRAALWLWLLLAAGYLANVFRVLFHKAPIKK